MKKQIIALWALLAATVLWGCARPVASTPVTTVAPTEAGTEPTTVTEVATQPEKEPTAVTEVATQPEEEPEIVFYEGQLQDADLISYPLQQLTDYFPYSSAVENNWCGAVENLDDYNYEKITAAFPGGALRAYGDADEVCHYTVYKVQEGGRFYVFWDSVRVVTPEGSELQKKWSSTMLYVPELKSYEDFAALEVGVSTGADVTKIDPGGQFVFILSSRTPSWHLLEDGSVLEVVYTVPEECGCTYTRAKWVISGITRFGAGEVPCALSRINPADLPN